MTTLHEAASLSSGEQGLVAVSTVRANGTIQSSLVNAGPRPSRHRGDPLGLRRSRSGQAGQFAGPPPDHCRLPQGVALGGVEGRAELAGPDDPQPWLDPERLRLLLREIFTAAGGEHDDWDDYDQTMAEQRRAAVLIRPDPIYGNS